MKKIVIGLFLILTVTAMMAGCRRGTVPATSMPATMPAATSPTSAVRPSVPATLPQNTMPSYTSPTASEAATESTAEATAGETRRIH